MNSSVCLGIPTVKHPVPSADINVDLYFVMFSYSVVIYLMESYSTCAVTRWHSRNAQFQVESVNPEEAWAVKRHNTICGVVIFNIYNVSLI